MAGPTGRVTQLLAEYRCGHTQALHELVEVVSPELRRIAGRLMLGERRGHVLPPTGLVNEAFLRLFNGKPVPYGSSREFFAASVKHMRRVLTDYARMSLALKRKEPRTPSASEAANSAFMASLEPEQLMDLNRALDELQKHEPDAARVVELKFYAGLSIDEIAAVLETSPRSVVRTWEWARTWLHRNLSGAVGACSTPSN